MSYIDVGEIYNKGIKNMSDFNNDKPRYSRISDILELIILMQSKALGITLADIQNRFHVSRRTAERLRDSILNILPVEEIETLGKEKHWGFINYYMKEIIDFTSDEIASLEALKKHLKHKDEKENLEKITTKLKALKNKQISKIEDRIELLLKSEGNAVSQNPNHKINIEILNKIREAIIANKKVKVNYNGKNKTLSPYGIIYGDSIYLIGVEGKYKDPYVYLLHKFNSVQLTDDDFDKGDFDIQKYANQSFGVYQNEIIKVELLFSKDVREDVLNYNFHPTQKITPNQDGTVTVKFKASGTKEILWHIFKWGDNVKIIAPKKLKEEYIDMLTKTLDVESN